VTVVADLGWSDVGDWNSVWQASVKDNDGVVARGNVHSIDCKDSLVQSDGPLIVGLGLEKMIAIGTKDAIFVAPLSRSQDMKLAIDALTDSGRSEATSTKVTNEPWGWFAQVHVGSRFQVEEISVNPGARLTLQCFSHQTEKWICVKGYGVIGRGDEQINIVVNQAIDNPRGALCTLENSSSETLHIIKVKIDPFTIENR
jgi:mannose-1-phosphate guanylyltransferase / mannose-6-phosphate isomerase